MAVMSLAHLRATAADSTFPVFQPRPAAGPRFVDAESAGGSIQGARHRHNDDHFLVAEVERRWHLRTANVASAAEPQLPSPTGLLAVVADGMSGHRHGDLASEVALDALVDGVGTRLLGVADMRSEDHQRAYVTEVMTECLMACQVRLHEVATRKRLLHDAIGTTVTAAYIEGSQVYIAHVGDSRAYLLRDEQLERLTTDHTLAERLRRSGYDGPIAPALEHGLVNAVGGDDALPRPDILIRRLEERDRLLLCTDGLTDVLDDDTISRVMRDHPSARGACAQLIEAARAQEAPDDVTAVVLAF